MVRYVYTNEGRRKLTAQEEADLIRERDANKDKLLRGHKRALKRETARMRKNLEARATNVAGVTISPSANNILRLMLLERSLKAGENLNFVDDEGNTTSVSKESIGLILDAIATQSKIAAEDEERHVQRIDRLEGDLSYDLDTDWR